MKIVAAALRDQVDHRALRLAKLCTEAIALNTKLLNRVYRRKHQQRAVRSDVHVVDAVNRPQVRVGLVAVNRHVDARVESGSTSRKGAPRACLRNWRNTGHHQRELRVVATVERQLGYLLLGDQAADLAAA